MKHLVAFIVSVAATSSIAQADDHCYLSMRDFNGNSRFATSILASAPNDDHSTFLFTFPDGKGGSLPAVTLENQNIYRSPQGLLDHNEMLFKTPSGVIRLQSNGLPRNVGNDFIFADEKARLIYSLSCSSY